MFIDKDIEFLIEKSWFIKIDDNIIEFEDKLFIKHSKSFFNPFERLVHPTSKVRFISKSDFFEIKEDILNHFKNFSCLKYRNGNYDIYINKNLIEEECFSMEEFENGDVMYDNKLLLSSSIFEQIQRLFGIEVIKTN
jgi:hypothetical protein